MKIGFVVGITKDITWLPFHNFQTNENMEDDGYYMGDGDDNVADKFKNYGLSLGVNINKNINIMADVMFMNYGDGRPYLENGGGNMKTIKMGLHLDYRFIKNYIVSPKIGIKGGFYPYSDLKVINVNTSPPGVDYFSFNQSFAELSWRGYGEMLCYPYDLSFYILI